MVVPGALRAKPGIQPVKSHRARKIPAAITTDPKASDPQMLSAISARRDHQAERQPRPSATDTSTSTATEHDRAGRDGRGGAWRP